MTNIKRKWFDIEVDRKSKYVMQIYNLCQTFQKQKKYENFNQKLHNKFNNDSSHIMQIIFRFNSL